LSILSPKSGPVNPILILLTISAFLISNCGFRLNRNKVTLPENARSIALQKIENRSFTPRLDILLRDILVEQFSRNSVKIQPQQIADLTLEFQINSASFVRRDYALDNAVISYEFLFSVVGKLTVTTRNEDKYLINNQTLSGFYSIKTESTDLSQTEITDGRFYALENLAEQITTKLTQNF